MTNTQHTQGPWNVRTLDYSPEFYIENAAGQQIVQSGEGLCNITDACLIGAAPDLLLSLQTAQKILRQNKGFKGSMADRGMSVAIAKATGNQAEKNLKSLLA